MNREYTHFSLFCGSGGQSLGFSWASATLRGVQARFRCLGGVDSCARKVFDFGMLVGRPATQLDLFSTEDYTAFHGKAPPDGWREATPADLRAAAGGERPDVLFTSPPCKGFSGLLSQSRSESPKYQALNRLTIRGIWLALEAWADSPPAFVVLENVPRLAQRGAPLVDQIVGLLQAYGYAVHKDAHDCGELGGLAQHRRRFLLLARHVRTVRPFVYRPCLRAVRPIRDVIGPMAMPEAAEAGPMHRLPRLQPDTLMRLALIPAGRDWRALSEVDHQALRVVRDGAVWRIVQASSLGEPVGNIAPPDGTPWRAGVLGVRPWSEPAGTVAGRNSPTNGEFSVADPRLPDAYGTHPAKLQVDAFDSTARTVTGSRVGSGALLIADPRLPHTGQYGQLGVRSFDDVAPTVTAQSAVVGGAYAVADPRLRCSPRNGTMGVQAWDAPGATVTSALDVQAGPGAVQDARASTAPTVIVSLDGTWHRPLTTLELAALQSVPLEIGGRPLVLTGSPTHWREAIGNMVPPRAAQAIGEVLLSALLHEAAGQTFSLGGDVWVSPDDAVGRSLGWMA